MERKSITFELKDLDKTKRTAIIAHAAYDNIDYTKDISRKGMFTKSWQESKSDISFYLNHNDEQAPGKVVDVYEDEKFAYTKAWLGTHTLGNDVLTMMDEGVIKKASFGYITNRSTPINIKGQKVRELKEVTHIETSVLTKMPANIKAGIVTVNKSFAADIDIKTLNSAEQSLLKRISNTDQSTLQDLISIAANLDSQSDLYMWVSYAISRRADMMGDVRSQLRYNSGELKEMRNYVATMEKFCRNTKASDDCIKSILQEVDEAKNFISTYNTASTTSGSPDASALRKWFNKN